MIVNPARGQLNRENVFPLSPFAPKNFVSQERFGRPVPRQPSHSEYSSGQSRVNRVTRLGPEGVHCRESAGAGSVVLNGARITAASFSGITMRYGIWGMGQFYAPLFSHTHYWYVVVIVVFVVCCCCCFLHINRSGLNYTQ